LNVIAGTGLAKSRSMKDNSFERAMNQIVSQAEAEQQQELRAQRRAMLFGRVRRAASLLGVLAVTGVAFYYRDQVGHYASDKFASITGTSEGADKSNTTPTVAASTSVAKAQKNAAIRDQVINEVSK
jgi:hypothetical protein